MPPEWADLLRALPGYDPFKGATGCWFDAAAAQQALDFFTEVLRHIEGDEAGKPFTLSRWQQSVTANLFGWKRIDSRGREVRRYRNLFVYVPRKNGKALDVDTPIPTPGGWRRMGDLRDGDTVFDQDGRPTRVLRAFPPMYDRVCYRVRFSDGSEIVADAEHLWETDARADRDRLKGRGGRTAGPKPSVKTTEEIRATLQVRGELNHRIPLCGALELPDADLPVPPYVLGAWLGDGDSDCARLTCSAADDELLTHVRAEGVTATVQRVDPRGDARRIALGCGKRGDGLHARLKRLGLFGNKHVPAAYLRGSVAQRTALLQGLMDTDGTATKAGQCEFTTTRAEIRDGFMELARSLGYKPSLVTGRARVNGKDCGEKYRIQFWAFADRPCFRLSRKAARLKPPPGKAVRSGTRQIVAVEPVESRPVRCIAVASERKLYLAGAGMVATHNTPFCAGLGLYVFFCDGEAGQQGYIAAKDKEQASKLFRQMEGMVNAHPLLKRNCRPYGGNAPDGNSKSFVKNDNSFLKVISGDAGGKHGGTPNLIIVDELHEQPNRELIDTLRTSMTSENRKQPLMLELTTADYDRPSICNERYEYAKKVQADPEYDPSLLPVIYEAAPQDPWDDERTWEKCNPNLGVSVSRDALRQLAKESQDNPALLIEFRRLHTNVRVQKTVKTAIDLMLWDRCKSPPPRPADLAAQKCWAGLDLGWRDDFAALVRLWELPPPAEWAAPQPAPPVQLFAQFLFWLPKEGKRDLKATPFCEFVAGGHIELTEGTTTDFAAIRDALEETRAEYDLRTLMLDPSYCRSETTELMNHSYPVVEFSQNMRNYTVPWKWFVADGLKAGLLRHGDNPVARWMAGNLAIDVDGADGVMPRKRKSKDKIDGMTALLMALAAYLADPDRGTSGGLVYDDRMPLVM